MFSSPQQSLGRHLIHSLTGYVEYRLEFGLTTCDRDRRFTVFRMKIEQNSCVIVNFNAILGD